ncbi:MAG: hypothetical protein N2516_05950 [Dictyoglomaceae bacterium]|nr:hypothetical protein [Dictyoglomaceae bacterium]
MNELDCKDFKEKMFLYPEVDKEFYKHFEACAPCKNSFEEWIKIEEMLKSPMLKREIELEWKIISKNIERRINLERYKKVIFIGVLTLIGILTSFIFFIFLFRYLNLSLILWGISIILKRIFNLLSYFTILWILLLAVKDERDMIRTEPWK